MIEPSPEEYAAIEEAIASDQSPVGIDAKKTHVWILAALQRIEQRLERLEQQVQQVTAQSADD